MIKYLPALILLASLHSFAQPVKLTCFNLFPGASGAWSQYLSSCNGKMIFSADGDTVAGQELWLSDGNMNGTHLLKDIRPGKFGSMPSYITVTGKKAFFLATEKNYNTQLWFTDGTEKGTIRLSNIDTNNTSGGASAPVTALNDQVLFWAYDSLRKQTLWISDGSIRGTLPVFSFNSAYSASISESVTYRNKIYFIAAYPSSVGQLWATDGTTAGTTLVDSFSISSPMYMHLSVCNDRLYFNATDSVYGMEPWISDGTKAGTHMLTDLYPGTQNGYIGQGFYAYKDQTYFYGTNGNNRGLYVTNGTQPGTRFIKATSAVFAAGYNITFGKRMYFIGDSIALYVSDGTANGTYPILDTAGHFLHAYRMAEYEGKLYVLTSMAKGHGLYRISETDSVETLMAGPELKSGALFEQHFLSYNNALWVTDILDTASGEELWQIKDTTRKITPVQPFAIYPNPNHGSFTISTADSNFTGRIHICDVAGRAVYYNNHVSGSTIHVTIPGAAAGVYFLTMQDISDPKTSRTINSYKIVVW